MLPVMQKRIQKGFYFASPIQCLICLCLLKQLHNRYTLLIDDINNQIAQRWVKGVKERLGNSRQL